MRNNLTNWATGVYTNEYLKAIDPTVRRSPGTGCW